MKEQHSEDCYEIWKLVRTPKLQINQSLKSICIDPPLHFHEGSKKQIDVDVTILVAYTTYINFSFP